MKCGRVKWLEAEATRSFQYCTDPSGQESLYLRALQGHSGQTLIDRTLQDNVLIPNNFFEFIYHVCNQFTLHREFRIDIGRAKFKQGKTDGLTKPRLTSYKQKWKRHQDTVYWIDIQLAQRKGLKFVQTSYNAIIPYDALPAYSIPKVGMMNLKKSFTRRYMCHLDHDLIFYKHNWMNDLDSDVAGSSKDTQRIQPKTHLSSTGRPVCGQEFTKEIEKRT